MNQIDTLFLVGKSLLGILGIMALIWLALVFVNFLGRRRGNPPDASQKQETGAEPPRLDSDEHMEHSNLKDKGE